MKTVFGEITTRFQPQLPQCPVPAMSVVDSKKDDPKYVAWREWTGVGWRVVNGGWMVGGVWCSVVAGGWWLVASSWP